MYGRLDVMAFIRASCYRLARFMEGQLNTPAMAVSYMKNQSGGFP
jgi:hypothetical protein